LAAVIGRAYAVGIQPNSRFLSSLATLWRGCASVWNDRSFCLTNSDRELPRTIETNLNLRELLYYCIGFAQC
jgi:hypothetical protein